MSLDLDAVVPDDIPVKLKGHTYTLPGDLPAETMLWFFSLQDKLAEASEKEDGEAVGQIMHRMYDEALSLFRTNHPDLEELPISFRQIQVLFGELINAYQDDDEPEAGGASPPVRAKAAKPRSSRSGGSKPRKSPSRRST